MYITDITAHKARKLHKCYWCCEPINPGDIYERYGCVDGGQMLSIKMHPECMSAMQRDFEDPDDALPTYRQPRGMTEQEEEDKKRGEST